MRMGGFLAVSVLGVEVIPPMMLGIRRGPELPVGGDGEDRYSALAVVRDEEVAAVGVDGEMARPEARGGLAGEELEGERRGVEAVGGDEAGSCALVFLP